MRYSNNFLEPFIRVCVKYKRITKIIGILLLIGVLMICWQIGKKHDNVANEVSTQENVYSANELDDNVKEKFALLTITDEDKVTDSANYTRVNLSDIDGQYIITEEGDYIFSGEIDGCIYVEAPDANIHLYLDNVTIKSNVGPAINIAAAGNVVITAVAGTDNIISDNGDYRGYEEYPACIFSDCNLTINGEGAYSINGYYKDAVFGKDVVKVLDGYYTIKCKRNAIRANDGLHIAGGKMFISTEKSAFLTKNKGNDGKGNLMVSGGEINIIAGEYSFVTEKASLYLFDCNVNQKSIINTFNIAKRKFIEEGCINE